MMNKKFRLIAMVAIVAVASSFYGISESNPHVTVTGIPQFGKFTFEEKVERAGLVVVGQITDVSVEIFPEDIMDTDENGNEYVFEHNEIPKAAITIEISEILKDDIGLDSKTVTFYDSVNGAIGESDSEVARYVSQYVVDYHVGDKGLFLADSDKSISGFASYYPISDGKHSTTSELDKLQNKNPIGIQEAKNTARLIADRNQ